MLPTILIAVGLLLTGLFLIIALQPANFHVERTARMKAAPDTVFDQVNDFHNWGAWNPWSKLDPNIQQTYEGAAAGKDAVYTWKGNSQVGEGRITIVDSRPCESVKLELEFFKPFKGTNLAEFNFKPEGDQTAVTWSMDGTKNFVMKGMCLVMSMDKMLGGQFEKGLADMRAAAEAETGAGAHS